MRATSFSTAALCSLGVLAAYGISNRVNSNPQPELKKQPAAPTPTAKLPIAAAITGTITPPETMTQPLSAKRMAQARQQREARLARSLAQVSTPLPVPSSPSLGTTQLPDVKTLPIDQIVAQSVGSAKLIQPVAMAEVVLPKPETPAVQPIVPMPIIAADVVAPQSPTSDAMKSATAPVASLMASAVDTATQVKSALPATKPVKPTPQAAADLNISTAIPKSAPESAVSAAPALGSQTDTKLDAKLDTNLDTNLDTKPDAQLDTQSAPQAVTQLVAHATQSSSPVNPPANLQAFAPAIPQQFFANPTNAAGVNEAYTLGPGDQLSLSFFNVPEYNGTQQVLADGTLNLPLVGAVPVSGLTLQQAESVIANRYQSQLRYAVVTASLAQTRPMQVAIVGEVQRPGSYRLASEGGFPGLVQAIQAAGGTTQAADLRTVQVLRPTPTNPSQILAVNLVDLLQGNLSQDLKLRDGDRILVPTAPTVDFGEASQFAASNFAAAPSAVDIAIVGEVNRPGAYKIGGEGNRITVSQAIQQAGGIKPSANLRQIQIRRVTRSGAEQLIDLDFWQLLQQGNISQDIALQQGDRIAIPTATTPTNAETRLLSAANLSPETVQVNVVGEVKSGGSVKVPSGSSLNQAILAAGGPNNRATREIELIRLDASGTLSRRTILVDMTQGFNTAENPLILNNDIIVVGRSGTAQLSDQLGRINSVVGPLLQLLPFRLPSLF